MTMEMSVASFIFPSKSKTRSQRRGRYCKPLADCQVTPLVTCHLSYAKKHISAATQSNHASLRGTTEAFNASVSGISAIVRERTGISAPFLFYDPHSLNNCSTDYAKTFLESRE